MVDTKKSLMLLQLYDAISQLEKSLKESPDNSWQPKTSKKLLQKYRFKMTNMGFFEAIQDFNLASPYEVGTIQGYYENLCVNFKPPLELRGELLNLLQSLREKAEQL